ncbi:MAG: hypothetical protein RR471_04715 [Bacteroides sp.]
MPQAKRIRLRRTSKANQKHSRKKEDGRPKGTLKKFPFEQTRLGFMLKYEAPVVYGIILNMTPKVPFPAPLISVIETVCKASGDPSLRKPKFARYLVEYAKTGIYCKRGKRMTPAREYFYESIRKTKLERFIRENKRAIEYERKRLKKKNQDVNNCIKTERANY